MIIPNHNDYPNDSFATVFFKLVRAIFDLNKEDSIEFFFNENLSCFKRQSLDTVVTSYYLNKLLMCDKEISQIFKTKSKIRKISNNFLRVHSLLSNKIESNNVGFIHEDGINHIKRDLLNLLDLADRINYGNPFTLSGSYEIIILINSFLRNSDFRDEIPDLLQKLDLIYQSSLAVLHRHSLDYHRLEEYYYLLLNDYPDQSLNVNHRGRHGFITKYFANSSNFILEKLLVDVQCNLKTNSVSKQLDEYLCAISNPISKDLDSDSQYKIRAYINSSIRSNEFFYTGPDSRIRYRNLHVFTLPENLANSAKDIIYNLDFGRLLAVTLKMEDVSESEELRDYLVGISELEELLFWKFCDYATKAKVDFAMGLSRFLIYYYGKPGRFWSRTVELKRWHMQMIYCQIIMPECKFSTLELNEIVVSNPDVILATKADYVKYEKEDGKGYRYTVKEIIKRDSEYLRELIRTSDNFCLSEECFYEVWKYDLDNPESIALLKKNMAMDIAVRGGFSALFPIENEIEDKLEVVSADNRFDADYTGEWVDEGALWREAAKDEMDSMRRDTDGWVDWNID